MFFGAVVVVFAFIAVLVMIVVTCVLPYVVFGVVVIVVCRRAFGVFWVCIVCLGLLEGLCVALVAIVVLDSVVVVGFVGVTCVLPYVGAVVIILVVATVVVGAFFV